MDIEIPFNVWLRRYIHLRKYERYCPKCKGKGGKEKVVNFPNRQEYEYVVIEMCIKCKGKGKIDWISNIINRAFERTTISYRRHKKISESPEIIMVKGKCTINPNNYY